MERHRQAAQARAAQQAKAEGLDEDVEMRRARQVHFASSKVPKYVSRMCCVARSPTGRRRLGRRRPRAGARPRGGQKRRRRWRTTRRKTTGCSNSVSGCVYMQSVSTGADWGRACRAQPLCRAPLRRRGRVGVECGGREQRRFGTGIGIARLACHSLCCSSLGVLSAQCANGQGQVRRGAVPACGHTARQALMG